MEEPDRTPGYVNQLSQAMGMLSSMIGAQGIGVSEKLDHSSDRLAKAIAGASKQLAESADRASAATEKHARSLAYATWALVFPRRHAQ